MESFLYKTGTKTSNAWAAKKEVGGEGRTHRMEREGGSGRCLPGASWRGREDVVGCVP